MLLHSVRSAMSIEYDASQTPHSVRSAMWAYGEGSKIGRTEDWDGGENV